MAGVAFWDGLLVNSESDVAAKRIGVNSRALDVNDATVAGYTGADYDTNDWNIFSIDNIPFPGIAEVKGLAKCNVKNKKAPGTKGNKAANLGYQPVEFDVSITIWTPSQWDIMQGLIDDLWNTPMANPRYIGRSKKIDPQQFTHGVDYPALRAFKIQYAVIEQFGLPHEGKWVGSNVFEIKMIELRDPGKKDVTATPKPAPVKRHKNFDGPIPQNSSQMPPPSANPGNMSLTPDNFTPAGGTS